VIDNPREVEQAYSRQYENLSREFSRVTQSKRGILAEIGCGREQLTIPLARLMLSRFLPECLRLLRHGGVTVHSFLSPMPRNSRQRLLIEADTNPRWTKTPPKEWFSPRPDQVMSALKQAEFRNIRVKRFKSNLIIRARAAQHLLESWDVKSSFWKKHRTRLVREGLEIPDWMIISGRKA